VVGCRAVRRIMGIDPGTVRMGFGVVEDGETLTMLDCGVITAPDDVPLATRLQHMYSHLITIITRNHPDEIAIEQPFMAKNARSALAIGRAEAIAMLAAAENNIPVYSYPPRQVKMMVTGYGAAEKAQVQQLVKMQLNLTEIPHSNDTSDALAVAICHLSQTHIEHQINNYNGDMER
jgi:crossover junction endodeoxyribonuclease RuvC